MRTLCLVSTFYCVSLRIKILRVLLHPTILQLATRMATYFGKLEEFHPDTETIVSYLERVDLFFAANGIADEKKVAVFLSTVGGRIYSLLRDLLSPVKPQEKTMAELNEVLKNHFEPKPLVIAERFYFHRRNQLSTESIAEYMAELRKLATHCDFRNYLNEALRDRLVCGLVNHNIQRKLLTEADLSLTRALEIAQSMEAAEANMKKLQTSEPAEIHAVQTSTQRLPTANNPRVRPANQLKKREEEIHDKKVCHRCGLIGHHPSKCPYREAVCRRCNKAGHLARVCRSKQPNPITAKPINAVSESLCDEDDEFELTLFTVGSNRNSPITVTLQINGQPVVMEVDTGAAVSLISSDMQKKYLHSVALEPSEAILTTYTGEQIPIAGKILVNVQYKEQNKDLYLYVVERDGPCLMGRDWLTSIILDWKQIGLLNTMVNSSKTLNNLLDQYQEVFTEGSGPMNTFEASLHLKPNAQPKFMKARPVPFALKPAVDLELD